MISEKEIRVNNHIVSHVNKPLSSCNPHDNFVNVKVPVQYKASDDYYTVLRSRSYNSRKTAKNNPF